MSFRVSDVLGYKPQELLNEVCYDFFHPDDLEHMMESYQQGTSSLTPRSLFNKKSLIGFMQLVPSVVLFLTSIISCLQ